MLDGFIFRANEDNFEESLNKKLFGEKEYYLPLVKELTPGAFIFLFNTTTKKLYGVFEADSSGDRYLDPKAFRGMLTAQIRVKPIGKIRAIDIGDIKAVIEFNGIFPDSMLNQTKVKKLLSIFSRYSNERNVSKSTSS